jgi:hypothetical protein
MSTRTRRWLLVVLALAAVAGAGSVGFLALSPDLAEAAWRCVPLGADEDAVIEALGRAGEAAFGGAESRRVLVWDYGGDLLLVEFNAEGRAARAWVHRWRDSTRRERLRTWLG